MNFSDNRYTDLIQRFDNWFDMTNVIATMRHLGLECDITPEDYLKQIKLLASAKQAYPDLSLDEAYTKAKESQLGIAPDFLSKGLGDTVFKITHATGLNKLSEVYTKITGKSCSCADRREALNKLFPYGVKENGM